MKKYLVLVLLATLFICCDDDDDDYSNANIVGIWEQQSAKVKEVKTNNEKATQAIQDHILSREDHISLNTFTEDGKFIMTDSEITVYGNYVLNGNKLILTVNNKIVTIPLKISEDVCFLDVDETEFYQDELNNLLPNEKDVVVSKVITTYCIYKRK